MKSHVLTPQTDLIGAVMGLLEGNENDYSANLVVFQGKRPAHMLRKRLAERAGGPVLPPRIHSADTFIDYLYTEKLGRKSNDVTDLDATGILLELQDVLSRLLIDDRNRKLESFLPFGLKLFQELEELKIGNVSPPQLTAQINAFLDLYNMSELLYLRDFYKEFYERLERERRSTRASRYAAVAENCREMDFSEWSRIIIAGYASPNPSEKALFRRLANEENTHLVFQEPAGSILAAEQFGDLHPGHAEPQEIPAPEYLLYESSDTHGQLFALSALLGDLQERGAEPDEKTVIVVSKPESLFPLLAFGVGHIPESRRNISLGYPFHRTPVFEFIMALMRTVSTRDGERYFAPAYLDFILHPYTKNILYGNRADVTRILLHTVQEEFFTGSSVTLFRLDAILQKEGLFERLVERLQGMDIEATAEELRGHLRMLHAETVGRMEGVSTIGEAAAALAGTLRFIFERSTARNHPFVLPFIQTAVTELERISTSGIAGHGFEDASAYERLLRRSLGGLREAFPGTPLRGLQILGLLETRNLKFDRVIVLDANEDALPGGRGSDMMLPQRMRDEFGLMTYRLQERLSEHYFHLLCQGAKEVHLMYRTGNGMERSRFVEQIVWKLQRERATLSEEGLTKSIQYEVALQNPLPGAIEKTGGMVEALKGLSLSPSGLDTYLSCPLQFYYRYVLRMKKQEDITGEIESAEIGTAVHDILERYFTPLKDRPLTPGDIDLARLETLAGEWFTSQYGAPVTGETLLVRTQVERRLRDFMEQHQAPLIRKHNVAVIGLEEWAETERGGITLRGKLDRVETRDGVIHILDYKTGGSLPSIRLNRLDPEQRETWGGAVGSLQLPMYVTLYAAQHNVDPEDITAMYIHLGRAKLDGKTEAGVGKSGTPTSEWYPALDTVIQGLIGEIQNPGIPFHPPDDPARACTWCEFKTVCGTRWL